MLYIISEFATAASLNSTCITHPKSHKAILVYNNSISKDDSIPLVYVFYGVPDNVVLFCEGNANCTLLYSLKWSRNFRETKFCEIFIS